MSSRSKTVLVVVLAIALVAVGAGVWWWLSDDAPEEVNLEAATEGVESSTTVGAEAASTVDGAWVVDAETGEFDYQSATGSFAGFRIDEELIQVGAKEAVGRTGEVTGTMQIEGAEVTSTEVSVDMATITTDESRRDDRVREALQTDQFPTATFSLREPIDLGDAAADGSPVSTTADGELTIHGVTQPVEVSLDAQVVGGTIVVVGRADVSLADFGVTAPTAPVIVGVSDTATIELQLLFVRQ